MDPYIFATKSYNNSIQAITERNKRAKKVKLEILQAQITRLKRLADKVFQSGNVYQYSRITSLENTTYKEMIKLLSK
jgi:hypothetical protein